VDSPYRRLHQPVIDFVNKTKKEKPDRLIAVILPEPVEPHWYEYLLHSLHTRRLRTLLYQQRDGRDSCDQHSMVFARHGLTPDANAG
jgi:hypothetical protein